MTELQNFLDTLDGKKTQLAVLKPLIFDATIISWGYLKCNNGNYALSK